MIFNIWQMIYICRWADCEWVDAIKNRSWS